VLVLLLLLLALLLLMRLLLVRIACIYQQPMQTVYCWALAQLVKHCCCRCCCLRDQPAAIAARSPPPDCVQFLFLSGKTQPRVAVQTPMHPDLSLPLLLLLLLLLPMLRVA
jgi:hypothetical protein